MRTQGSFLTTGFTILICLLVCFMKDQLGSFQPRATKLSEREHRSREIELLSSTSTPHTLPNVDEPLPLPLYMVVALHTNIGVFLQLMTQVQPQLSKDWTVCFVVAQLPAEPEQDWSVIRTSKEYRDLSTIVHSITFSKFVTKNKDRRIANDFGYNHKWWNATPEYIKYFWLVQDDSAVCSTNSEWCISDFFGWDYLGAPWSTSRYRPIPYGNGGFSLRSRRLQVECTHPSYFRSHNHRVHEDHFFSVCLRDKEMNFKVAPLVLAQQFSSERPVTVGSFGWHLETGEPICNDSMIRYCPEALYAYKRWRNCSVPQGLQPAKPTARCQRSRTSQ